MTKELVIKRLKLLSENKGIQTLNYDEARILLAEIERLNNIINKLEKYLIEQVEKSYSNDYDNVLDKLYELTGENNDK